MSLVVTSSKVDIFDDNSNPENKKFNDLYNQLNEIGIIINHYIYGIDRNKFINNKDVWMLINCTGREMLPATCVNDHLIKIESYPTKKELLLNLKKLR